MSQPQTTNTNTTDNVGSDMVATQASHSATGPSPSTATTATGKKREIKLRSIVWEHFTKYVDDDGEVKARCHYCEKVFPADSRRNGTSRLRNHMASCKKHAFSLANCRQTQLKFEKDCDKGGEVSLSTWKFDQNALRKALSYMIIVDELSFKFVERNGFKKFISVAQPRFQIPSRFTVSCDCYQLYLDERSKLKEFFSTNNQRVCLTTDTWSSLQRINYMCLTAHFIDSDWNLHKKILNFCPIVSHKGLDIGRSIEKCLIDWGIERIFTITVDNASSNDVGVSHMKGVVNNWRYSILGSEFLHMRCVAHIINLVVQDGLSEVSASIIRIRAAVRYIRQSPARLKTFKECAALEKIESKSMLCLDVPMRWNSTYLMLEVAQKFERAFKRFEVVDPMFKLAHAENYDVDAFKQNVSGVPTDEDWVVCRRMVSVLKEFYDLTLFVSGSRYVTCSAFFDELCSFDQFLKKLKDDPDIEVSLMADGMHKKYKKYWGNVDKINILLYVAPIFDPRYKLEYVCFILEDTYGDEIGESMRKKVIDVLHRMYASYCSLLASQSQGSETSYRDGFSCQSQSSTSIGKKTERKMEMKMRYKKHKSESGVAEKQSELERFLAEAVEEDSDDFDILHWWRMNAHRFPIVSHMARDVLAVPISTVASESAFSSEGRILDSFRSSLSPNIVQALICAQDWLRGPSQPIGYEESVQDVDKIEEDLSKLSMRAPIIDI